MPDAVGTEFSPKCQKIISSVLSVTDGCINHFDDTFIDGRTKDQRDKRLQLMLDRLAKYRITLNPDKCQFARTNAITNVSMV